MTAKFPAEILRDILSQRGKVVTTIENPFHSTFLKYIKKRKGNRDFLYNELKDRQNRDKMLFSIYNNEKVIFSDGTTVSEIGNLRNIYSATFEWYVAELLYREFQFSASAFGVKIKGSPEGGDFDVLGATHSGIIAIECKSGKPSGIDEAQIQQFVKRHKFLRADYSILYIDYKGLLGEFPFELLSNAVHPHSYENNVFKIESGSLDSNANFYAVQGSNIYVLDNSKNTGNVIKNLRFLIDTHYALKNVDNNEKLFDIKKLEDSFGLNLKRV